MVAQFWELLQALISMKLALENNLDSQDKKIDRLRARLREQEAEWDIERFQVCRL